MMPDAARKLWGITEDTADGVRDAVQFLSAQVPRNSTHRKKEFGAVICADPAPPTKMGDKLPYVQEGELDGGEFAQRFLIPNRPCMVRGCSGDWRASRRWSSPDDMQKWYGNVELRLTEVQQALPSSGGSSTQECRPVRIPLANYLPYAASNTADFPWYAFDDDFGQVLVM